MIHFLRKLFRKPQPAGELCPECLVVVTVDDEKMVCRYPNEPEQVVEWKELQEVAIVTNDRGPLAADFFWCLVAADTECCVPEGATNEEDLVNALEALPGFDWEQMVAAMRCTENGRFVCWQKKEK